MFTRFLHGGLSRLMGRVSHDEPLVKIIIPDREGALCYDERNHNHTTAGGFDSNAGNC